MIRLLNFFKRKPKEKLNCLGYYETKQFHSFEYALIYAKEILIKETDNYKVFGRVFKNSLFVVTLVFNEIGFQMAEVSLEALAEAIKKNILEEYNQTIEVTIFKNKNEQTTTIAKEPKVNTKNAFKQVFVYNSKQVRIEFYRPVPNFYKLYDNYAELIYFDLAAIDPDR